ncbi:MAG TPA: serine hydrolase [Bacteroidia bacterium]|nr:serine hydrolase [Bacteroidia bacterium]
MLKFFKRTLLVLLVIIIAGNLFILLTGRQYLYKGIWNTYLKGRSGPSALEYGIFANRRVDNGKPQPWPVGKDYNTKEIPAATLKEITELKTGAFLVISNDSLRYEKYWGEFSDRSYSNSFSMAKTVVSILVGCAIADGHIKSIDQPVHDFLPEYKNGELAKVTIKHLVIMSSAIAFNEDYVNPLAYPAESYYGSNLCDLTMAYQSVRGDPGVLFDYQSGNTQLLGFVLKKATGKTVADYASEKLWIPMGAEKPAFWSLDHENGDEKAFCCLNSNARDFARIGKLYLDSGRWSFPGDPVAKQLVPEDYVLRSVLPTGTCRADKSPCVDYGYSWWMIPEYKGHFIFYARGILGQYIFVIPGMKMVIVRLGEGRLPNGIHGFPEDIPYYLDAALAMYGEGSHGFSRINAD